jgi:hypothetical protein
VLPCGEKDFPQKHPTSAGGSAPIIFSLPGASDRACCVTGFIVDHELSRSASPGDSKWLAQRIDKFAPEGDPAKLNGVFSDRGFASKRNTAALEAEDIFDGLCPRDPNELGKKMKDEVFAAGQKRRAQTEARVGIVKNVFLDAGKPRAKGFAHRQMAVQWAVMAHNLRVLVRMRQREEEAREEKKPLAA